MSNEANDRLEIACKHLDAMSAAMAKQKHALDNLCASLTLEHVGVESRAAALKVATDELKAATKAMNEALFPEPLEAPPPSCACWAEPDADDDADVYAETGVAG
jgi:peptidoglycan hydrolase CwlO-like protein